MTSPDSSRGDSGEKIEPTELSEVLSDCMLAQKLVSGKWWSDEDRRELVEAVAVERKRIGVERIRQECEAAMSYLRELCAEGRDSGRVTDDVVGRIADKLGDVRIDSGTDAGVIGFEAIVGVLADVLSDELQESVSEEGR